MKILAINPGSTSTKIAVYENLTEVFTHTLSHSKEELSKYKCNNDQLPYRKGLILNALETHNLTIHDIDIFVGRGGGQCSHIGGTYRVNQLMVDEAHAEKYASHPALLACQIAFQFANETGREAYMVNSPATDEMKQVARITGMKGIYRICYCHALNQKEIALRYAESIHKDYSELNLIICHLGGGISITAHEQGKMIDTNDILNGDGPMAPTRVGSIPAIDIMNLCFSGKTKEEVSKFIRSQGGLYDHLGTFDVREIVSRIQNGDVYAANIYNALIYQISKYIGSMYVAMKCQVDAIILTGGIAHDEYMTNGVKEYVNRIAPVVIMPGEFEMEALVHGAYNAALNHSAYEYTGIPVWDEKQLYEE